MNALDIRLIFRKGSVVDTTAADAYSAQVKGNASIQGPWLANDRLKAALQRLLVEFVAARC